MRRSSLRSSLRLRLFLAAVITTAVALSVAAIGLSLLFEQHVARGLDEELHVQLQRLVARITIGAEGTILPFPNQGDPRFQQPLSGSYWQVSKPKTEDSAAQIITSRSLWDEVIPLPAEGRKSSEPIRLEVNGPKGSRLIALSRVVIITDEGKTPTVVRATVARDEIFLKQARNLFLADLLPSLVFLGAVLITAAVAQTFFGLRPLELIRREITAVRQGLQNQLSDQFPTEVQPLADELNGLLKAQATDLTQARDHTADLAHGLMTPLTALAGDIRRLREAGLDALASDIECVAEQMRQQIHREMSLSRIRGQDRRLGRPPSSSSALKVVRALVRLLERTPRGETLTWRVDLPDTFCLPMEEHDGMEMLGNIMENACRYAQRQVRVSVESAILMIDDDGPGIPAERRLDALQRGVRLDAISTGSGLGLAISARIAEAYGLRVVLLESPLGGARVAVKAA